MKKSVIIVILAFVISNAAAFAQWQNVEAIPGGETNSIYAFKNNLLLSRIITHPKKQITMLESHRDIIDWSPVNYDIPYIFSFYSKGDSLFACTKQGIYLLNEDQTGWTKVFPNLPNPRAERLLFRNNTYFALTHGVCYRSSDDGATWDRVGVPQSDNNCMGVTTSGDTILLAGYIDLFVSYDKGTTWSSGFVEKYRSNWTDQLFFYDILVSGKEFFAGNTKGILYSFDGGQNWDLYNTQAPVIKIDQVDKLLIILDHNNLGYGKITALSKSNNTFSIVNSTPVNLQVTDFSLLNGIIYAATRNGVYVSNDTGATWRPENKGLYYNSILSLASHEGSVLAGGNFNGLYWSTDNGESWEDKSNPEDDVHVIKDLKIKDDVFYGVVTVAGAYYKYAFSSDNGINWRVNFGGAMDGKLVLSILPLEGKLIAGTNQGIYKSLDSGKTWEIIDSTYKSYTFGGLANNDKYVFASSYQTGLLRSSDFGETWYKISDAFEIKNMIGVDASDSIVAAYNQNGYIYLSTDYGESWNTINQPFNDISSICIQGKYLIVGSNLDNVYISGNLGKTWKAYGKEFWDRNINSLLINGDYVFAGTESGLYRAKLSDLGVVNGIEEPDKDTKNDLVIWPNPAGEFIELTPPEYPFTVIIYDNLGKPELSVENMRRIDVGKLPAGIHFCAVKGERTSAIVKFLIIR